MRIHELKIDKGLHHQVLHGYKRFEIRKNDRDFGVRDLLRLRAYDSEARAYLDDVAHPPILVQVKYMLHDHECRGLRDGYVVMGIERAAVVSAGPPPPN